MERRPAFILKACHLTERGRQELALAIGEETDAARALTFCADAALADELKLLIRTYRKNVILPLPEDDDTIADMLCWQCLVPQWIVPSPSDGHDAVSPFARAVVNATHTLVCGHGFTCVGNECVRDDNASDVDHFMSPLMSAPMHGVVMRSGARRARLVITCTQDFSDKSPPRTPMVNFSLLWPQKTMPHYLVGLGVASSILTKTLAQLHAMLRDELVCGAFIFFRPVQAHVLHPAIAALRHDAPLLAYLNFTPPPTRTQCMLLAVNRNEDVAAVFAASVLVHVGASDALSTLRARLLHMPWLLRDYEPA